MKKIIQFLFISFLIISCSGSDEEPDTTIFVGDYTVNTQQKANDFNFTSVTGRLVISGNGITDISNLASLTNVGERLQIQDTRLQNLNGLQNVVSGDPGAYLGLFRNDLLRDIGGVTNYSKVVESIVVEFNESLSDLSPLEPKSDLNLVFLQNIPITNVDFLNGVTSITQLSVFSLRDLNSLEGLSDLTSSNSVALHTIPGISNLNGLENLTSVEDLLSLWEIPLITDLSGFTNLSDVGEINIRRCNNLLTLDGASFRGSPTGSADLYVTDNPLLTDFCGLTEYCNNTTVVFYENEGNAYNPTVAQIRSTTECRQ